MNFRGYLRIRRDSVSFLLRNKMSELLLQTIRHLEIVGKRILCIKQLAGLDAKFPRRVIFKMQDRTSDEVLFCSKDNCSAEIFGIFVGRMIRSYSLMK